MLKICNYDQVTTDSNRNSQLLEVLIFNSPFPLPEKLSYCWLAALWLMDFSKQSYTKFRLDLIKFTDTLFFYLRIHQVLLPYNKVKVIVELSSYWRKYKKRRRKWNKTELLNIGQSCNIATYFCTFPFCLGCHNQTTPDLKEMSSLNLKCDVAKKKPPDESIE